MNNPYSVLGVEPNADIEQVKQAYRALARRYHDDCLKGGSAEENAKRKMDELDAAYDSIMAERQSGSTYQGNNYQSNEYSDNHSSFNNDSFSQFGDIKSRINSGRIDDAETLLDGIPNQRRNAEWYFLKGQVQQKRGWFDEAYKNYSKACQLDPSNTEYSDAFNSLNRAANGSYRNNSGTAGDCCDPCRICQGLICADCCCECLGGDLC